MKFLILAFIFVLIGQNSGLIQLVISNALLWILIIAILIIILENLQEKIKYSRKNLLIPLFFLLASPFSNQPQVLIVCSLIYIMFLSLKKENSIFLINSILNITIVYCIFAILFQVIDNLNEFNVCKDFMVLDLNIKKETRLLGFDEANRCIPNYIYEILPNNDKNNIFGFQRFSGVFSEPTILSYYISPLLIYSIISKFYTRSFAFLFILLFSGSYYFIALTVTYSLYLILTINNIKFFKKIIIVSLTLILIILMIYLFDQQRLTDFYLILLGESNKNFFGNVFSVAIESSDYSFILFYLLFIIFIPISFSLFIYFILLNLVISYWITPWSILVLFILYNIKNRSELSNNRTKIIY